MTSQTIHTVCPKCKGSMVAIKNNSCSVKKCEACHGMWLSDDAIEFAKDNPNNLIANLDNHQAGASDQHNMNRDIDCPQCNQRMTKMIDKDQMHIEFEACSDCNGVFLDSGEFKDLTDHTLLEKAQQTFETFVSNLKS